MDTCGVVHTLFEEQAKRRPKNIAASFGNQSITYDELNKKANQLAYYLLSKNLQTGSLIAFCLERSFECLITIFAILKAGAAYLPLDSTYPDERLLFILKNSKSSFLVTTSEFKSKFTEYQGSVILIDHNFPEINKQKTSNPELLINAEQLAYVIYTSGSTGTPKGVLIEHRSVVNYSKWFADYSAIKPKQRIDFSANHTFDMAITATITPLMLGLSIVLCDDETKKNTQHYLKYLKNSKINIIKITPSFFKLLVQEIKNKYIALPYLKTIILGGENLSKAECKSWLEYYPKHTLHNEYGPTETTVAVSQFKICSTNLSDLGTNIPIGKIGYNIDCMILDANNSPVSNQEIGELYLGGVCLARGYLNQPEITKKQFIKDPINHQSNARWYKTGDLCRLGADGILEYFGRTDSQIKIRGYRIEPAEIEKHLSTHPGIDTAIVLAQKEGANEERLSAYFIPKDFNNAPTTAILRLHLQKLVPDFMIPTAFICIKSLPLNANGKLDKELLPIPQLKASQHHKAPLTDLEKILAGIWSEELRIKEIGIEDDFFELGGHSLSAARIISKINRVIGTDITLRDFYYATNIAQLTAVISKSKTRKPSRYKRKKVLLNNESNIPLSDFQFMLWISDTFESKAKKLNITARKRLQGKLDKAALEFAFNAVLKKQEVLFYRVLKLRPVQLIQKGLSFSITEINLELFSEEESEQLLEDSMNQLIDYYPWPKDAPLIVAKLFYLKNHMVELQISIPHIVCDDYSPEILLSDLSQFYLLYNRKLNAELLKTDKSYKEYILNEQQHIQKYLDRDMRFWDKYLMDAGLFTFSSEVVVTGIKKKPFSYSTYTKIPEAKLNKLKRYCANNHISLNEGLCAAVALALNSDSNNKNLQPPYVYMNIVKSTRNNEAYDDIIGCFLRLEPVKIALNKYSTLEDLTRQIHQSTIETSPYQQCPDLVKLSAIGVFRQKKKIIKNFIINVFTSIYAKLFSLPTINRKVFKLCSERLSSFQRTNNFLININVQKNFISKPKNKKMRLFGLDTRKTTSYQYDLLKINNIFDVCFIRDDNNGAAYIVISANLNPEYREFIAKETIRVMGSVSIPVLQEN